MYDFETLIVLSLLVFQSLALNETSHHITIKSSSRYRSSQWGPQLNLNIPYRWHRA